MRHILFVCTGNICRSPMAASLLRKKLADDGRANDVGVSSAGTWAVAGAPASGHAQRILAEQGIDLRAHRARDVTGEILDRADLVLTMTRAHREALVAEFPSARGKTYLLSEMAGRAYDISDPYGASPLVYQYTARELADLIERGYGRILELAGVTEEEPE